MKKIILGFIAILVSITLNAQNDSLYVLVSNTTSPNVCDGYAYLTDTTGLQNWEWYSSNNTIIQSGGILMNLCPGTYFVNVYSNGVVFTYTFTIGSGSGTDCNSLSITIITNQNASSPTSYDGSLSANASGGTAPYTYSWNNGQLGATIYQLTVGIYEGCVTDANGCVSCSSGVIVADSINDPCNGFYASVSTTNASSMLNCNGTATVVAIGGTAPYTFQANNTMINNGLMFDLCEGSYYVLVSDANGCSYTSQFYIYSDNDTTVNTDLYVYPSTSNVSAEGACDGTVYFDVYGGVPPYTFIDINGVVTNQYVTGLCEGVYSAYITDASGQAFSVSYFIASPDNVIDNGGWNDTTTVILDTLTSPTLEDCIIDYLTLDSAYISNIDFVTLDSILVTWSIIDANGIIEIIESYNLDNGFGLYEFLLQIFCPQRATNQYIIIKETRMLTGSSSALTENNLNNINLYPNPVQDVLNIAVGKSLNTNVTVTDITGKIVYNMSSTSELIKVDFNNFEKGQYIVNVSNNEQNTTTKIIK
jgi:hypothetical protein